MSNSSPTEIKKAIQKHRDFLDDYSGSVMGLHAFCISACWDEESRVMRDGANISIPRTMEAEADDQRKTLTPDGVVQVLKDYGIIVEMKKHFLPDDLSHFEQIKKYDVDLVGWWTGNEKIQNHDLVLLTHYFSSTSASDAYRKWIGLGNRFQKNFAIVEFSRSDGGQEYFALKRTDGELSDRAHDQALRNVKPIPNQIMIQLIKEYKFYDAKPPLMLMLLLLHDYVFTLIPDETEFERETERSFPIVSVTVEQAAKKLQEQFYPRPHDRRQPHLPRTDWVKEALDCFVKMDLASLNMGKYKVVLKKPRKKDMVEYFALKLLELEQKKNRQALKSSSGQGELFEGRKLKE